MDLIVSVLGNTTQKHIERCTPLSVVTQVTSQASNLEECSMFWMMLTVFPQTSNFRIEKLCSMCFEDNEAVIKMIIKGKRHVSRSHRVALDWLFDRINWFKIQIKNMDTENQLADILQSVLKWCRKERKKIQVKKESQQNRNQWWIWSRDAGKGLLMQQKTTTNILWFGECLCPSTLQASVFMVKSCSDNWHSM